MRKKTGAAVAVGAAIVACFALGFVPLSRRERALAAQSAALADTAPLVSAAPPRRAPPVDTVLLPGTLEALEDSTIYARVQGYVKAWRFDIGDEVKAGDLLAELETPELDQEQHQAAATLAQLRARLLTAEASARLARSTFERYQGAAAADAVSLQLLAEAKASLETAEAAVEEAKENIKAGEASVQRLNELLGFAKVRAPYDGVVTQRMIERGDLVTAGNGTNQALFRLQHTSVMRVFVHVPQVYAPAVKPGVEADVVLREYPGRVFKGRVTRSARSLDTASRTLRTQIEVDNADRALLPGMYAAVKLSLPQTGSSVRIPASALVVSSEGTRVATVTGDRVHFELVTITADFGTELAVDGVRGDERVVVDPSDRLSEGAAVRLAP